MNRLRNTLKSDRGLTLVELMVYVALLGLVMAVLSGIFISINTSQKTVTAVTSASNQGQAAANLISKTIGNSSAIKLIVPKTGDQLLMLRTAKQSATVSWVCQSWYYQSAANASDGIGNIRYTTSTSAIPTPSASTLLTWTSAAAGVTPVSGSTIFNSPLIVNGEDILTFSFYVTGTGQKPQLITTSSTTSLGNTGSSPCF